MTRNRRSIVPDLYADPFQERRAMVSLAPMQVLGARIQFESHSHRLLHLARSAYADLPRHRLSKSPPLLRIGLVETPTWRATTDSGPPPFAMFSGAGFVGGAVDASSFVIISPPEHSALVSVSSRMLRSAYHTRYELIEFSVFTLAARVQGLISLHGACVGVGGKGILLMGASGSGKSTVTLMCLLAGFELLAEDSVFVEPGRMLATGVSNYLHVRADTLDWFSRTRVIKAVRASPIIRRRSGVRKFEVDLRRHDFALAARPLQLAAIVFLSPKRATSGSLLEPLSKTALLERLTQAQAYAANQPGWGAFCGRAATIAAFELRRGGHPQDAARALSELLRSRHSTR